MYYFIVCFLAVVLSVAGHADVTPPGKAVELRVKKVFIPVRGFDDNDRIEAVVEGELPNPCFTLGESRVEKLASGEGFRIVQMAWRRYTGACDTGDLIDDPIPFYATVPLGQLRAARYRVEYTDGFGKKNGRVFDVGEATSAEIDEFDYAVIRQIDMEEGYNEGSEVIATVRGFLPAPCFVLPSLRVETLDDIVLILPVMTTTPGVTCKHELRPFKQRVSLGRFPKAGSHLVHTRSRGGNAVYRPFLVWEVIAPEEVIP